MTQIRLQDGKPIVSGGKVGVEAGCCCGGFVWCDLAPFNLGGSCNEGFGCGDIGRGGNAECSEGCSCHCVWCVAYYTWDNEAQAWKQGQMTECIGGFTLVPDGYPGAPVGNCHKTFVGDSCAAVDAEVRAILDAALGGQQGTAWDDAGTIFSQCYGNPLP